MGGKEKGREGKEERDRETRDRDEADREFKMGCYIGGLGGKKGRKKCNSIIRSKIANCQMSF